MLGRSTYRSIGNKKMNRYLYCCSLFIKSGISATLTLWVVFFVVGVLLCTVGLSSIPGFYPSNGVAPHLNPSCDKQKCLLTQPNVPWRLLVKNYWCRVNHYIEAVIHCIIILRLVFEGSENKEQGKLYEKMLEAKKKKKKAADSFRHKT